MERPAQGATPASAASFALAALQHSISLSDQKAGSVLGFSTAISLASLAAFNASPIVGSATCSLIVARWLLLGSSAAFLTAAGFAFVSIRPRLRDSSPNSMSFWGSEAFKLPQTEFLSKFSTDEIVAANNYDQMVHIFVLAQICRQKYGALTRAFVVAPFGVIAFVASQLLRAFG